MYRRLCTSVYLQHSALVSWCLLLEECEQHLAKKSTGAKKPLLYTLCLLWAVLHSDQRSIRTQEQQKIENTLSWCGFMNKYILHDCVCTCLRSLWVAAFALTLLLSKVCVNLRRLCSSGLIAYWPQMARALPQAEFICGTRTTSSHTCPISHWSLSTKLHTEKSTAEAQQCWYSLGTNTWIYGY